MHHQMAVSVRLARVGIQVIIGMYQAQIMTGGKLFSD